MRWSSRTCQQHITGGGRQVDGPALNGSAGWAFTGRRAQSRGADGGARDRPLARRKPLGCNRTGWERRSTYRTVPTLAVALVRIGQTGRGRRGRCGRSARADRFFLQALRRVECDTPVIVGLDGESQQSGSEPSPARCDRTVVRTAVVRCPLSPDGTCGCWIRSGSPTTAPGLPTTRARLPQCPAGSGRGAPCSADPVSRKRQKRERPWVTSPARDACYAASIAGNVTSQSSD